MRHFKKRGARTFKDIIETGSFMTTDGLQRTIDALDRRILALRKKKPTSLVIDEIHRANIFRDEFDALRKCL